MFFTLAVLLFDGGTDDRATQTIIRQYTKKSFQSHELFEVGGTIERAVQLGYDEINRLQEKGRRPLILMDHKQYSYIEPGSRGHFKTFAPIEYPVELMEAFAEANGAVDPKERSGRRCVLMETLRSIEKHRSKKRPRPA